MKSPEYGSHWRYSRIRDTLLYALLSPLPLSVRRYLELMVPNTSLGTIHLGVYYSLIYVTSPHIPSNMLVSEGVPTRTRPWRDTAHSLWVPLHFLVYLWSSATHSDCTNTKQLNIPYLAQWTNGLKWPYFIILCEHGNVKHNVYDVYSTL